MKRNGKKWISLLLVCLLLAVVPLGAAAAEEESQESGVVYQWSDGTSGYALRQTDDSLGGGEPGYTAERTFSAAGDASYDDGSFYSQLTARQKACYNALNTITVSQVLTAAEVGGYREIKFRIPEMSGIVLTGTVGNFRFEPDQASEEISRGIYTDLCAAIIALRYDRPDAFWLSSMRYGYNWVSSQATSVTTTDVIFSFRLNYDGQEQQMWDTMMASAHQIARQVDSQADQYSQVMQVHDLLAAQSRYNTDPADAKAERLSHQAYSCLVAGDEYEPVCDGYAKAVKVVCDLLDIPCVLVSSATHMWNNIKMDDGDWYNLDLTWDDSDGSKISYDYFLVGSQVVVEGQIFSRQKDHVEANPWQESSELNHVEFSYPVKNHESYAYLGENYPSLRFPDVKRSAWYYGYVESAAGMGLFVGDETGFFQPEEDITRAQFVQALYNVLAPEDYVAAGTGFTDIKEKDWYYNAVCWAGELGVVSGYLDGGFHPGDPISRQEMCVVLDNYMSKVVQTVPQYDGSTFEDDAQISTWARNAVYHAYSLGVISGDEFGNFNPGDNTIRCEAATVFVRYLQKLDEIKDSLAA